jgi:hypothetical protein
MTVTQTSSTGDKPSSIQLDRVQWRRDGSDMILRWSFYASSGSGATSGTGDYLFHLPSGYSMDSGKVNYYTTNEGYGDFTTAGASSLGFAHVQDNDGGAHFTGQCFAYDDTKFRMAGLLTTHATVTRHTFIGSDNGYTWANMNVYSCNVRIPIAGWSSTFNPVLSMPLVDIGRDTESITLQDPRGATASSSQRVYYGNELDTTNYDGSLFTYDNDSTTGLKITFNQNVDADINFGALATSSQWMGINKNYDSATTGAISVPTANTLAFGNTGSANIRTLPYSGKFKAGDYLHFHCAINSTSSDGDRVCFSMTARRDRSNTNMAHIIKPAVANISEEHADRSTAGGDLGAINTWHTRVLNTMRGETWFIESLSSNVFTLEKGMYKVTAQAPLFEGGPHKIRLYNTTDSSVTVNGQNAYCVNTYHGQTGALLMGSFTITKSTGFRIEHIFDVDSGGANQGSYPSGGTNSGPSVFTTVMIEKLK